MSGLEGVLGGNGKIYTIPFAQDSCSVIDPVSELEKQVATPVTGPLKWIGGIRAPNGKICGRTGAFSAYQWTPTKRGAAARHRRAAAIFTFATMMPWNALVPDLFHGRR